LPLEIAMKNKPVQQKYYREENGKIDGVKQQGNNI
jgi:hypothetical protein